ncbi:hypothetical protein QQ045_019497 [Rhodiola kirilowii]
MDAMRSVQGVSLSVLLLFFFAASVEGGCGLFFDPKYTVIIRNNMTEPLRIHCKSKNDDLGSRVLPPEGAFDFSFKNHIGCRTHFWCDVYWTGRLEVFDAYYPKGDSIFYSHCRSCNCEWFLKRQGPCYYKNMLQSRLVESGAGGENNLKTG